MLHQKFKIVKLYKNQSILALGAESAGNFSFFFNNEIYFSNDFGNLLIDENFQKFKKSVFFYLKNKNIKPNIVLTDIHPLYKTTAWGEELAKKFKAKHIKVQHHLAHIFSAFGEKTIIENCKLKIENCIGIACDGTGYGLDEKIWGGEVFKIQDLKIKNQNYKSKCKIKRIGCLENQTMIGGDLAIKEPARMLISILNKIKITNQNIKLKKNWIYEFIKKYYTRNQFELLYNQLQQNFNCQETSSTGRILDAVSILLEFCKNESNYKHEPIDLLEKNSSAPYLNLKPKLLKTNSLPIILSTSHLFEYLIKNLHRDKKRLAATAQLYIAQGLYQLGCKMSDVRCEIFFSGGIANNKIISNYMESKKVYVNKKIPRGDAGLSFGQIIYFLLNV